MYKTGCYIFGSVVLLISSLPFDKKVEISNEHKLDSISIEYKEKLSNDKELKLDSIKCIARQEIALLNEQLNIK